MRNTLTPEQEARRRQTGLVFDRLSPQTFIDLFGDDRDDIWRLGSRVEHRQVYARADELGDKLEASLSSPIITEEEKFFLWKAMDRLRTVRHCLDRNGEAVFRFRPEQQRRLTDGIPDDPDDAIQHLHRCAFLTT